jgi:hypothetical protein
MGEKAFRISYLYRRAPKWIHLIKQSGSKLIQTVLCISIVNCCSDIKVTLRNIK